MSVIAILEKLDAKALAGAAWSFPLPEVEAVSP
jgi:hypothetical protein